MLLEEEKLSQPIIEPTPYVNQMLVWQQSVCLRKRTLLSKI